MPQTCTICRHEKHDEINQALVDGESFRNIARRTGTSTTALFRHKAQHLPRSLVRAKETVTEVQAETLFERLRTANRVTLEILQAARSSGNHIIALQAIGRIERQLELEARLLAEMPARNSAPTYPEYDNLTVEQLEEHRCILQAELERVRRLPQAVKLIEAAPGSFKELHSDQSTA